MIKILIIIYIILYLLFFHLSGNDTNKNFGPTPGIPLFVSNTNQYENRTIPEIPDLFTLNQNQSENNSIINHINSIPSAARLNQESLFIDTEDLSGRKSSSRRKFFFSEDFFFGGQKI